MKWLDKIRARLVPEEINGHGRCTTYLYRWTLLSTAALKVYLHRFVGDDWAIDLHDHPKRFWSIGLRGAYIEERADGSKVAYCAPWIRTFPADHRHRLTGPTPERPCWTIVIVGRPVRNWGFWQNGEWIHWREYVAPGSKTARHACEGEGIPVT